LASLQEEGDVLDATRQKFAAAPAKHPYVLAWDDGDKKDTHKSAEHIAIPLPLLLQYTSPQQSLSTDQEQNSTANTYWQERDELQLQLAREKETCQQLQQQAQQQEKQIDARSMTKGFLKNWGFLASTHALWVFLAKHSQLLAHLCRKCKRENRYKTPTHEPVAHCNTADDSHLSSQWCDDDIVCKKLNKFITRLS